MEEKLTKSYADAWSENQGSYSEGLAKKIHNFIKLQNLNINSALDICCGSANFLNELQKYGIYQKIAYSKGNKRNVSLERWLKGEKKRV